MTGIVIPVLKRKLIYIRAHAREQRNKDKSSKNTELRNKTDKTDKLMRNKTKTYDYGSTKGQTNSIVQQRSKSNA